MTHFFVVCHMRHTRISKCVTCDIVSQNYGLSVTNSFLGYYTWSSIWYYAWPLKTGNFDILPLWSLNECKGTWKLSVHNFDTLFLSSVTCDIAQFRLCDLSHSKKWDKISTNKKSTRWLSPSSRFMHLFSTLQYFFST